MTRPKPASMAAVIHRFRSAESISSWNSNPRTTIGTEPMITSHPIRAAGSSRGIRPTRDRHQCLMMVAMSCRK